jgi:hypothetical protein
MQTLHYVGGSNVKSILKTAYRIKNRTPEWRRVVAAIRSYLLSSDLSAAPESEIIEWTKEQSRGGLSFISDNLFKFMLELSESVKILEHMDGSLYTDEVIDKVASSGSLIRLWDVVLQGSLPTDESFKLLHALCSHFCNTWRNGIISRRLNELCDNRESVGGAKHGQSGVAFRATIKMRFLGEQFQINCMYLKNKKIKVCTVSNMCLFEIPTLFLQEMNSQNVGIMLYSNLKNKSQQ